MLFHSYYLNYNGFLANAFLNPVVNSSSMAGFPSVNIQNEYLAVLDKPRTARDVMHRMKRSSGATYVVLRKLEERGAVKRILLDYRATIRNRVRKNTECMWVRV